MYGSGCLCEGFIYFIPAKSDFKAIAPFPHLTEGKEIQPGRETLGTLLCFPPSYTVAM